MTVKEIKETNDNRVSDMIDWEIVIILETKYWHSYQLFIVYRLLLEHLWKIHFLHDYEHIRRNWISWRLISYRFLLCNSRCSIWNFEDSRQCEKSRSSFGLFSSRFFDRTMSLYQQTRPPVTKQLTRESWKHILLGKTIVSINLALQVKFPYWTIIWQGPLDIFWIVWKSRCEYLDIGET